MQSFNITADDYILKPSNRDDTVKFKVIGHSLSLVLIPSVQIASLDNLLEQYPMCTKLELWDDLEANLNAFRSWGEKVAAKGVKVNVYDANEVGDQVQRSISSNPSVISKALCERGLSRRVAFTKCADQAIDLVSSAWLATLCGMDVDLSEIPSRDHLVQPFGSFLVGRESDVDLVLVGAAERGTVWSWFGTLEAELRRRGIEYIYLGQSTRCPRLVCKVKPI